MNSQEARIILEERRRIAAIIERNQQKLHKQMRNTSAEWVRWGLSNQWLALEKQRLQILCHPNYRAEGADNHFQHTFPMPGEKEEQEPKAPQPTKRAPSPSLPNFDAVQPEPKPALKQPATQQPPAKRGRRPKAATPPEEPSPQPCASPSGAAQQSHPQKGTKKAR